MIGLYEFHDLLNFIIFFIFTFVTYIIIRRIIGNRGINEIRNKNHSTQLEIIWTIIPAIILIIIAIPSFKLLYALDEIIPIEMTVKIKGAQWYWNYEISDIENININYDSYTMTEIDLNDEYPFRLLDVDNRLYLPIYTPIRLLYTSEDVIHSFTIPSFGIKTDCIPGRINTNNIVILRPGVFYGQCSELCGQSHYNMSIVIESLPKSSFYLWLSSFIS